MTSSSTRVTDDNLRESYDILRALLAQDDDALNGQIDTMARGIANVLCLPVVWGEDDCHRKIVSDETLGRILAVGDNELFPYLWSQGLLPILANVPELDMFGPPAMMSLTYEFADGHILAVSNLDDFAVGIYDNEEWDGDPVWVYEHERTMSPADYADAISSILNALDDNSQGLDIVGGN